jgi:hypothetical protein
MKKSILLLGLVLLLTSCAQWFGFHGSRMIRISPGMSKADVIRQLGSPRGVGGQDHVQILYYQEDIGGWQWSYYFVRLVDGKVESYGKGRVAQ